MRVIINGEQDEFFIANVLKARNQSIPDLRFRGTCRYMPIKL